MPVLESLFFDETIVTVLGLVGGAPGLGPGGEAPPRVADVT